MAYLILQSKHTRQPQGQVRLDTSGANGSAQFVVCGSYAATRGQQFGAPSASSNSGIGMTPDGVGYKFGGGAGEYARFDTNFLLAASSACSIEFIVYGSSFPSLAHLFGLAGTADTTGGITDINGATRSILSFNGGPPCNIYGWGGINDADSNAPFVVNARQHIIAIKSEGTGVCDWVFYRNGLYVTTQPSSNNGAYINTGPHFVLGGRHAGGSNTITGTIPLAVFHNKALSAAEVAERFAKPWSVAVYQPRRLYFAPSGGGATIITSSGAASLVTKATAAVAATKTTTTVARSAVNGTAAATSIRVGAAAAKATSTGTASTTTIRTATISARATGAGTAAATTMRTGIAAGRLTGSAETTYAAIVSGTFTAAGRTPARGTAAYTSTHAATAAATAATRGTAASTTLRTGIAAARLDARAAVTAAALVAGTVTTSAAAQIGARASVTNTTERVATVAAMLALRGATPAAPELPVIVPPSTRTLSPDHTRLGLSPVAPAKPRLG